MVLGPGVQQTIGGVTYTSRLVGSSYVLMSGGRAVSRITTSGQVIPYVPLTESPAAAGAALAEAMANVQSGETIDCGALRCELPSGSYFAMSFRDGVKIQNGFIRRRNGTDTYSRMMTLSSCNGCEIDLDFDGEAQIQSPNQPTPAHICGNPNQVANSYLLELSSCTATTVRGRFAQHAGQQLYNSEPAPYYNGANAVVIGGTCRDTNVLGAYFETIGYAGVQSLGQNTYVGEGTVFDDTQWHGVVVNAGSYRQGVCLFKRIAPTTLGYQGCLDINAPNYACDSVYIDGSVWAMPYNHPGSAAWGMFMIKVHGCDKFVVKNSEFLHGENRTTPLSGGYNHTIRFAEGVGDAEIVNCSMSGGIGHIDKGESMHKQVKSLAIVNSDINKLQDQLGVTVTADRYHIEDSVIRYASAGLIGRTTAGRCQSLKSVNTIWQARGTQNGYAVAADIINGVYDVQFDNSNQLRNTETGALTENGQQDGSYYNRKSHTDVARLQLTTRTGTARKKVNTALSFNFAHPSALQIGADPYQTVSLTTNSSLSASTLPLAEGDTCQVRVIPNGYSLTVPGTWGSFVQPSTSDPFIVTATIVNDNGLRPAITSTPGVGGTVPTGIDDLGILGGSVNVDFSAGSYNNKKIELSSNTTFTFSGADVGGTYTLSIKTAGFTVTFPASVAFFDGAPTFSSPTVYQPVQLYFQG